jgi:CRP-like cAMP-binding protein
MPGTFLELLRETPLFSTTPEETLSWLSRQAVTRSYEPNQAIVYQNEPGNAFYIILAGRVKVVLRGEEGKEVILTTLGRGEFFGEMAVVDGLPRSASVIAIEPTKLLIITREVFLTLIQRTPELALSFIRELSRRLRLADAKIESLALLDVYGRVARVLREIGEKEGRKEGNEIIIEKRPTQTEIAAMAGTSRETVSRILSDFIRSGYISIEGKKLILHEPHETKPSHP